MCTTLKLWPVKEVSSSWRHHLRLFSVAGLHQHGSGGVPSSLPAVSILNLVKRYQNPTVRHLQPHAAPWKAPRFIHDSKRVIRELPAPVSSGCRNPNTGFLFPAGTHIWCVITVLPVTSSSMTLSS